jgi:hypothetical protein
MTGKPNLAASVAARLLKQAKATGDDYQTLLTTYCLERFLYRLGVSDCREQFVLKGAPTAQHAPDHVAADARTRALQVGQGEGAGKGVDGLLDQRPLRASRLEDARDKRSGPGTWRRGGPWR